MIIFKVCMYSITPSWVILIFCHLVNTLVAKMLTCSAPYLGYHYGWWAHVWQLRYKGDWWYCLWGRLCYDHGRSCQCRWVDHRGQFRGYIQVLIAIVDTGANASAEEQEEGVEDGAIQSTILSSHFVFNKPPLTRRHISPTWRVRRYSYEFSSVHWLL